MNLNSRYESILAETDVSTLENFETEYTFLQQPENWFKGLALLEKNIAHFDQKKEAVVKLYENLFHDGLDFHSSYSLNDEDYIFYWNKINEVLENLATHWPEAYAQLAFQYQEARRNFQDKAKVEEYLLAATHHGAAIGRPVYAYFLYYDYLTRQDKEEATRILEEDNSEWGKLYRGYMYLDKKAFDSIPPLFEELQKSADIKIVKNGYILEACCYEWQGNPEKAKEIFKYCMENYFSAYAMTRYALINYENSPEESMNLLEQASVRGNRDAMNNLGHLAFPKEQSPKEEYEKSLKWFTVGELYGNAFSTYRLALIYLYVEAYKNTTKGLEYLDQACEQKLADALVEKAEIYLEDQIVPKDVINARLYFERATEANQNPYAYYRLGYLYELGLTEAGTSEPQKALPYYEKAAELNHFYGNSNAGRMHRYGIGTEVDNEKARKYFEKGLEQGNPYCITELAFMYEDGTLDKDYGKAFELFTLASETNGGYGYACYIRGQYLEFGYHTNGETDQQEAVRMYEKGAELQEINCIYEMGRCYRYGIVHEQNPDLAVAYFQKAADAGLPKGMVELAMCYDYEFGVSFDAQKTFDLMKEAAEMNYPFAQYKTGSYLMHGSLGEPILADTEQALMWLNKAKENNQPYAFLELGDYYLYDYDQLNEYEKALSLYLEAYNNYEVISDGLGICYEYGLGTEANASEAFKYYEIAANKNNKNAMYRLGKCYLSGTGTRKNESQAYHWFATAANYGDIPSQFNAGLLLLKGNGVAVNKEEGIKLIRQAAEQNHAAAQFELGNCYLMGDGVEESEEQTMYWYELAAENGHEKAKKIVRKSKR